MSFAPQDTSRSKIEVKDPKPPLLSICVPSYNRGERIRTLVDYLLPTVSDCGGVVELIVSNNASKDATSELLGEVSSPYFRLYNRTTHLPTAEEHIFHSAELCRGTFIWFLGDDDIPNLSTVLHLLRLLQSDRYDFLFFNSLYVDAHAGNLDSWFLDMNREIFEAPFSAIAPALGFISTLAGLSNVVCRRSRLDKTTWPEIVKVSYIYSHVVWWYLSFNGGRAAIVNRPLVSYRVDDSGAIGVDFRTVATKSEVGDHHFWTVGLIRLFIFMEERGAITANQIRNIWERRRDGSAFRLLDDIFSQFFSQVILGVRSDEKRNRLTDEVFNLCRRWFLRVDPSSFEGMKVIELVHAATRLPKEDAESRAVWVTQDFEALFVHRLKRSHRYLNIVSRYKGYDIYVHISGYVAIAWTSLVDRQDLLRRIDLPENDNDIVVGSDEPTLHKRIDELLEAMRIARLGN